MAALGGAADAGPVGDAGQAHAAPVEGVRPVVDDGCREVDVLARLLDRAAHGVLQPEVVLVRVLAEETAEEAARAPDSGEADPEGT